MADNFIFPQEDFEKVKKTTFGSLSTIKYDAHFLNLIKLVLQTSTSSESLIFSIKLETFISKIKLIFGSIKNRHHRTVVLKECFADRN